ncbi:MAG: beta-lactamase family protein [Lachnospiraceae bacterium]|nr:beta-lactamase family protein [Lachnospiraceae bacterium]
MDNETAGRIDNIIKEAIDDGVTMGANLLVYKDGTECFYCEHGYADREAGIKISRDNIFRLYSMSKPITAVAAMILMQEGRLDIGQPVDEILDGFKGQKREDENGNTVDEPVRMTVQDLLNMTSGLSYGGMGSLSERSTLRLIADIEKKMFTDDAMTTLEVAEAIGKLPLKFTPGSSWCYGLSADVLGAVIEKISGKRFGDFLEENIFKPLGMKDTGFFVPQDKQYRLAKSYASVSKGEMVLYTGNNLAVSNDMKERPAFESGGAGLVSTIDDYMRFCLMLLNKGSYDGTRILSGKTVSFLTSGNLTGRQQEVMDSTWPSLLGFTYSHLMRQMRDPGSAASLSSMDEYGWDGWLGCYFACMPSDNMAMVLMQQKKDSGTIPMTRKLRNVIIGM